MKKILLENNEFSLIANLQLDWILFYSVAEENICMAFVINNMNKSIWENCKRKTKKIECGTDMNYG